MKTNKGTLNQKKKIHAFSVLTLVLLIVSFLWLFYNLYAFNEIKQKAPTIDTLSIGLAIGFLVKGVLYISFILLFLASFKYFIKFKVLGILCIVTGIASAIALVFDFAALSDIGHEYLEEGLDCFWEWTWLYLGMIIHFVFYITGFFTVLKINRELKTLDESKPSLTGELYFEIVQYVGIVCGLIGTIFSVFISFFIGNTKTFSGNWIVWLILVYSLVIIVPYMAVVLHWFVKLSSKNEPSNYDEKQKNDLAMSGLTTWFISIPALVIFFAFNFGKIGFVSSIMWFPFYLFVTILTFSLSALYRYKKG